MKIGCMAMAVGVLAMGLPFAASAETVYRYLDESGNVVYSQIAPEGVEAETIELPPPRPDEAQEALDERVRRQLEVAKELEESRRQREADRRAAEAARQPPVIQRQPAPSDEPVYLWPHYPPYPPRPPHPPRPRPPIEPPPPQNPPAANPPRWPL